MTEVMYYKITLEKDGLLIATYKVIYYKKTTH